MHEMRITEQWRLSQPLVFNRSKNQKERDEINGRSQGGGTAVRVTNGFTGEERVFCSMNECARVLGMSKSHVSNCCKAGKRMDGLYTIVKIA